MPGPNTQVATLSFDHIEDDNSPLGEAVWWAGALEGVAQGTTIRYRIGAWRRLHPTRARFADYGSGGLGGIPQPPPASSRACPC
ncbi:MAG: hypothetical protein U1F77_07035 [Kiritimatiellia bacterium]